MPVDQGHGWGYRYFHSAWMALPLLATAALFGPARSGSGASTQAPLFQDGETKSFVATCILLSLLFGVGFRAWQMQDFIARDVSQVPQYVGTERRVVILDDRHSFYGADLVQNDPWLRGNEIRMYSHGAAADERMMAQYYPGFTRFMQTGTVPCGPACYSCQRCKMFLAANENRRGSNMRTDT